MRKKKKQGRRKGEEIRKKIEKERRQEGEMKGKKEKEIVTGIKAKETKRG